MGLFNLENYIGLFDTPKMETEFNELIAGYINSIEIDENEDKNVLVVSIEKDGKCYVSECGMKYNRTMENWQITKTKKTVSFYKLILNLIKNARRGNN